MNTSKRASSSSPPLRRPSKARDFRSLGNIHKPNLNRLHTSPAAAAILRPSYCGKDVLRSNFPAESPFDSSTSHPSEIETVAPSDISYPFQSHDGLPEMNFSNFDRHSNLLSHDSDTSMNRASGGNKSDSIYHAYGSGQYGSETSLPICKVEGGYLMDIGSQEHSSFDQGFPYVPGFEQNPKPVFNNFELELRPAPFPQSMSNNFFDVPVQQDAPSSPHIGNDDLTTPGDHFSFFDLSTQDYPLGVKHPHKTISAEFCSPNSRTCMKSALKILRALHIPPRTCLWASYKTSIPCSRQPRLIDAVLSTNKDIVKSVSNMLKCTCSLSSQLQLILTIICGKVLAWYRAIIRNDNAPNDSSMLPPSTSSKSTSDDDFIERILHQPITLGRYSFDGTLESKIRAQVVFSELQYLETMIETLSGRIQTANFSTIVSGVFDGDENSMKVEERGRAETIRRCLSSFLREQLQAAKDEPNMAKGDERGLTQDSGDRPRSGHSR